MQWRHLKALKRGGRGHDPSGADGTIDGGLAILCPSCPHPRSNIPSRWMDLPDEKQFVYCICCRKVLMLMFYLQISVFEACLHGRKFLTQEQLGVELICGPGSWKWHGVYGSAPAI